VSDSDKKAPLDDFDWDAALAEWDKQPFTPEVANEKKEKEKPPVGDKPLYRPPMKTTDPATSQIAAPPPPRPPRPAPPAKPPPPVPAPAQAPGAPRKRGGLGQLFSRPGSKASDDEHAIDVFLEDPAPRKRFRAEDDDEGVVTSAVDVETSASDIDEALLATTETPGHDVPDGALFDPFAEPQARPKELPTVHPPPMALDEPPRPPQSTSPAFDDALPEEAIPSTNAPSRPPPPSEPERVQSVTSEVEELHEFEAPKLPSIAPRAVAEIEDERSAASWLDEETIASLRDRAVWLEAEARNVVDKIGSAKLLLAVSELRAVVGDASEAMQLADEARAPPGAWARATRRRHRR